MATTTSSPTSASNSSTQPLARSASNHQVVAANDNGVLEVVEKTLESIDPFEDYFNSKEQTEKFKKYEADYTRRLMAKYFADKDIYGGNIFGEETTVDGHVIRASRWPGFQSYADPAQFRNEKSGISSSTSTAQSPIITSNGKYPIKEE